MPFRLEYLCRPPEAEEMSQKQTFVHDEVIEEFVPTCRHCKKTKDEHVQDKCLFEATAWAPMDAEEWAAWRKSLWLAVGDVGTNYIREQLRNEGFARRVLAPYSMGTKK